MRYVISRYQKEQREKIYRIYVTDSLKLITENTGLVGGGKCITLRYAELMGYDTAKKETRTADEIIDGIRNKLRQGGELQ